MAKSAIKDYRRFNNKVLVDLQDVNDPTYFLIRHVDKKGCVKGAFDLTHSKEIDFLYIASLDDDFELGSDWHESSVEGAYMAFAEKLEDYHSGIKDLMKIWSRAITELGDVEC